MRIGSHRLRGDASREYLGAEQYLKAFGGQQAVLQDEFGDVESQQARRIRPQSSSRGAQAHMSCTGSGSSARAGRM